MRPKVAIIGAGASGCFLSHLLCDKADVTLFEKSRGVGGRCSSRRDPVGNIFHHGAQFFTIRDPHVKKYIQPLLDLGLVKEFFNHVVFYKNLNATPEDAIKSTRYVGYPQMNSFLKSWVEPAECVFQFEVKKIQKEEKTWSVMSESQEKKGFDLCIVTAPIPQALKLTQDIFTYPNIQALPCYALMLTTPHYDVSWSGAFIKNSPLSWVAHQRQKDRDQWVLHGSALWSSVERDETEVFQSLLSALSTLIQTEVKVDTYKSHFWRYASIQNGESVKPFLWDRAHSIGVCGDWYCGGRVEGALQSAYQLEAQIKEDCF